MPAHPLIPPSYHSYTIIHIPFNIFAFPTPSFPTNLWPWHLAGTEENTH